MARFGFTSGGTYTSESPNVAAQRCVNWYPENTEIDATTPVALYPTPGLSSFANLTGAEVRGMYEFKGRLFVVTDKFYEVFSDGTYTGYSFLPDDKQPVTMAANNAGPESDWSISIFGWSGRLCDRKHALNCIKRRKHQR